MAPPHQRPVFASIDILRGFAALSVLVYHVIEHFKWADFPTRGPLLWFRVGWMGVDLFLVISGFVITLSLGALLERRSYRGVLIEFARRRFRRIAPLYFTTCAVYVVFIVPALVPHAALYQHALAHIFFVHNLSPEFHGSIDGPNWSVALEVQFYLFYALLAPLLFRMRWWQILLGGVAISWAWRYGVLLLIPPDDVFRRFLYTTQLPGTLDEFAVGIAAARLMMGPGGARLLDGSCWMPAVTAAAASVWLMLSVFWPHASYWDVTWMVVAWRTACGLAFGLVVFAACCLRQSGFLWATAPLRYLGTISFGIYLWHLPVLLSLQRIGWLSPLRALCYAIPITVIIAAGSWHLLERPAMRRA